MTDAYPPIIVHMDKKILPNPYEIQQTDVGRLLDLHDFGKVLPADVGKLVYLRKGIIQMENAEQHFKRKVLLVTIPKVEWKGDLK